MPDPQFPAMSPDQPLLRRPAGGHARTHDRAPRRIGAIVAIALHAAAAALLMTYEPARTALLAAAPIMVDWITPPKVLPQPPKMKTKPVEKPRVVEQAVPKPVAEPTPVLTTTASAPSPVSAPPLAPAEPVAAVSAPPAPAAVIPPVFNADYLENPSPSYPPMARRMGEQGRVMLRVLVSTAGRADEIQLQTSSGSNRLDDSARDTVRRWKFVPARRGSEAVAAWVLIPISFRLEG